MSRKSAVIITLIIFGLGIGGVYYFRFQKRQPIVPSPTPEAPLAMPSVPSDWKTYKSPNFGYSITYPPDFTPREQGKVSEKILDVTSFVTTFKGKTIPVLQVKVSSFSYQQELENRGIGLSGFALGEKAGEKILVSGTEGAKVVGKTSEDKEVISVFLPGEDKTFILLGTPEADSDQDYTETINKMISTFKFP